MRQGGDDHYVRMRGEHRVKMMRLYSDNKIKTKGLEGED
jgi:hypothetical protein